MSLWTSFLGAEIRYIETPSFGRVRIVEAGRGNAEMLIFMHGIGGHLEAYAKNVVPLSNEFHVVAYDFLGHGLSSKTVPEFSPPILASHLGEVMDALGIARAHLSGESLGGWVAGLFAAAHPQRVGRIILNTSAGIPITTEKGREDLKKLVELSARNAGQTPTHESVLARMQWLMHEDNWHLLDEELVGTRLALYLLPDRAKALPAIGQFMKSRRDEYLVPLESLSVETLFLWTRDNPIHDVESAKAACARTPHGELYVMKANAAHWPQYEAPEEFNAVVRRFLQTGTAKNA